MMDRKTNPIQTWPRNLGQILAIYLEAFSRRMILPMAVLLLELESTGPNLDHIGSRSPNSDEKMGYGILSTMCIKIAHTSHKITLMHFLDEI